MQEDNLPSLWEYLQLIFFLDFRYLERVVITERIFLIHCQLCLLYLVHICHRAWFSQIQFRNLAPAWDSGQMCFFCSILRQSASVSRQLYT